MSAGGEKIFLAMQEAIKTVRCKHDWQIVSTLVGQGNVITRQSWACDKCGCRRTDVYRAKAPLEKSEQT